MAFLLCGFSYADLGYKVLETSFRIHDNRDIEYPNLKKKMYLFYDALQQ